MFKLMNLCLRNVVECTSFAGAQQLACWQAEFEFSNAKRSRQRVILYCFTPRSPP